MNSLATIPADQEDAVLDNPHVESLSRIDRIEAELLQLPQVECPLKHYFAPGICIREVVMPANATIIGHAHRFYDMNIVLSGRVSLVNDNGTLSMFKAPLTFLGKPGRKIAFIHEECIWQNVFPTELRDVEAIEETFLDRSPAWVEAKMVRQLDAYATHESDRLDYLQAIEQIGMNEDQVLSIVRNESDQMDFPVGEWKVKVSDSPIHGLGLFATGRFEAGETIAPSRIGEKRTPAGRFTNHSKTPNAVMVSNGCCINLVAVRNISGALAGMDGEEITVDYREANKAALKMKEQLCLQ